MTSLKAATDGVKTAAKPKIDQGTVQPIGASQTSDNRASTHGPFGGSMNLLTPGDLNLSVRPTAPRNLARPHPTAGILDIGHSIRAPFEDTHPSGEGPPVQIRESQCRIGPLLDLPFKPRSPGTKVKKWKGNPKPPNPKALYLVPSKTRHYRFFWGIPEPCVDTPPASPEMPVASTSTSSTASGRQPLSRTVSYMTLEFTSGSSTPCIDTPPASPEMSPTPVASTSTSSTASGRQPLSRTESYLSLEPTSVNLTRDDTPPASPEMSSAPASSTSTSPTASKRQPLSRTVSYMSLQPIIHQTPALGIPVRRVDTPPASPEMSSSSVSSTSINSATPSRRKLERTISYRSLEPMVGGFATSIDDKSSTNASTAKASSKKRARDDEWDLEAETERPSQRARTEAAGDDDMEGSLVTGLALNVVGLDQTSVPASGSSQTADAGSKSEIKIRFVQEMSFQIALEKFKESRGYGAEASH